MKYLQDYLQSITPENISLLPQDAWRNAFMDRWEFNPEKYMEKYRLREQYIQKIGFPIYTEETISSLVSFLENKKVIEVGSGSGFLSKILSLSCVNIVAVDSNDTTYSMGTASGKRWETVYQQDIKEDAVSYLNNFGNTFNVIIMCWPDYNSDFAYRIAKTLQQGQVLIYQGEGWGGCTGGDSFHELITNEYQFKDIEGISDILNSSHIQFEGIHDKWYVYEKL